MELIVMAIVAVVIAIYSYVQMRKMQKKNQQKANQLDGTVADEGTSFSDIAGSPHMYGNITHMWDKSSEAIKEKSGKK